VAITCCAEPAASATPDRCRNPCCRRADPLWESYYNAEFPPTAETASGNS
jgi:hypothetical protein